MKVHLPALDQLDEVLDRFLAFGQTTTSIVQSTPVPPRGLPLPGEAGAEAPSSVAPPAAHSRPP